jgi:predicted amidophosphoribosyltransferase
MQTEQEPFVDRFIEGRNTDLILRRGQIAKWFRSCAVCASFLPPIDIICDGCKRKLFAMAEVTVTPKSKQALPFEVRSVLEWNHENDFLVRPLLHAMKGGPSAEFVRALSLVLIADRRIRNPVFIPAPSSKKDHAYLLAKIVSGFYGGNMLQPLEPTGDLRRQRDKSKEDRETRQFRIKADMVNLIDELKDQGKRFVFIDDVITTGATVRAAFEALGRPKKFEAWSLARRPRLAAPDRF